ncbi:hypothetical protein J6590_100947 [Homalodisca vitripennis]|nr:hypothetical protein J6590_100947 [Homalodisca vitripennis]
MSIRQRILKAYTSFIDLSAHLIHPIFGSQRYLVVMNHAAMDWQLFCGPLIKNSPLCHIPQSAHYLSSE